MSSASSMAAAEASTADQQHSTSRATRTTQWNRRQGEKARRTRGARVGHGRHSNGRPHDAAAAAPSLGAILSDALALALAQHARSKPCGAIAESEGAREELQEPLHGREGLTKEKSAAKAGRAVAAPRTAAAPWASLTATNPEVAERRWNGSPHTSRAERGRARCASSNARHSHFSADQPATLTNSEPGSGGTSSQGGTSWAGLFDAASTDCAASTLQPQGVHATLGGEAEQADSRAEAQQLSGRVDAEQSVGALLSLPLPRPLPSLPRQPPPIPLALPQQARAEFWHPRKDKARVLSAAGPAALASSRAVCPELPLTQPVRLLRRTSTLEHWAAAAAKRAPPLATPRVQSPVLQIEYYFSALNLQSDFFLRRHIEADAHGFVALELLNSFPQSSVVKLRPPSAAPVPLQDRTSF